MLGTKIVMDEAKIIREGRCDLTKVYQVIDKFADRLHLKTPFFFSLL